MQKSIPLGIGAKGKETVPILRSLRCSKDKYKCAQYLPQHIKTKYSLSSKGNIKSNRKDKEMLSR